MTNAVVRSAVIAKSSDFVLLCDHIVTWYNIKEPRNLLFRHTRIYVCVGIVVFVAIRCSIGMTH